MSSVPGSRRLLPILLFSLAAACTGDERAAPAPRLRDAPPVGGKLFTRMPSAYTGVRFENRLEETQEMNVFTYRNYYNGGGVALGDLTGDGLPEIVLTSNLGGPRLYLNEGHFRFRDVTDEAGLDSRGKWTTGVVMADVDGDGRLDLYVCHAGRAEGAARANALWINQGPGRDGVPTFRERAGQYGIADEGYSTQAAFLDYDRDGRLDLYVVNNSPQPASSFGTGNTRTVRSADGGDRLYHNEGGRFVDVSGKAGIYGSAIGLGLGVGVADVNRDGWPDLYVANDFAERDYLYLNRHDGTFGEVLDREMPVLSYFSMGLDIADVDNDGWPDVYTTDMLPEDDRRLKLTSQFESWRLTEAKARKGFHYQSMRNMLQRNNGNGTFSDLGEMAGVAQTDWSWSALIADLDLDGLKDIFVTNGMARDVTSQDYIAYLGDRRTMAAARQGGHVDFLKLVKAMSSTALPNYAFHNRDGLHFENDAAAWGLDEKGFSNGAAYGDLDGDGAPDLVVNDVDGEASVYRNNARTLLPANHYLEVRLDGAGPNRFAIGARVTLRAGARQFVQELQPTRGFQSSVDYVLTFGVGAVDTLDSVTVEWPDGRVSEERRVAADRRVTIRQAGATRPADPAPVAPAPLFRDESNRIAPGYAHRENDFVDFERERLMPRMLSREGPAVAAADVDGDGLDDVYLGGAKNQAGELLLQQADGGFRSASPEVFAQDALSEDVGAVFFDANGDGRPDLYVVSGGNEYADDSPPLQDRLYLNEGRGRFRKEVDALPPETASGSRVAAADFDGDGAVDLFVGGRVVPWHYGEDPRSLLLKNDGRGHFRDVTAEAAPGLARVGMVTDALWRDVDGDGRVDLVVVGEWMPITVFRNTGHGRLARMEVPGLERSNGWWNRIVAGDFTGDGRVDFIVGNFGLNSRLHASEREPVRMYVKDFLGNGLVEQVISSYVQGRSHPLALRDELLGALPELRARFPTYAAYAGRTMAEVFPPAELKDARVRNAYTFATALARNDGDGSFTLVPLPAEAQVAPVYGILPGDFDGDGTTDLLLAGNFGAMQPGIGRMEASYGLLLLGDGKGGFAAVPATESGFLVPGESRGIVRLRSREGPLYLVARNDDRPLLFAPEAGGRQTRASAGGAKRVAE